MERKMEHITTLTEKIEEELLRRLMYGEYRFDRRLPPETEIAEDLGVSRNVVRSAMSALEREGYVSHKRGVGTIINHHVLEIRTRMDLANEYQNIIESAGYKPDCAYFQTEEVPCDEETGQRLHIKPGKTVLCVSRMMTANGAPAIFGRDYFDPALLGDSGLDTKLVEERASTFTMLAKADNPEAFMAVADVSAIAADEALCGLCGLKSGAPILLIQAVHYTFKGKRLFFSREYYINSLIRQTVVRKKIYSNRELSDVQE
jgi:GntR family transcriptional regulator